MDAIRQWAFSVCAAMVAGGMMMQLMPKSNLTGIIKLVVSVFFLCCLMSPAILRFPGEAVRIEEYSGVLIEEKAAKLTQVVESQMRMSAEETAQKFIAQKLGQMGIKYHSITINISVNGQSETADSVDIVLDKSLEPSHEQIASRLEAALQMDVRLDYF